MNRIRFTKEGFENLQKELEELRASRPNAVEHLKKSRELGDLSENGYYKASRAKLSFIDGRISRISYNLKIGIIADDSKRVGIGIGSSVTLKNDKREMTYHIVGDLEADPMNGKLSLVSPIGRAIEGKKEGDDIIIETPSGSVAYTIKKVS